jgi:electron transfer flavoprotein alpha subunit
MKLTYWSRVAILLLAACFILAMIPGCVTLTGGQQVTAMSPEEVAKNAITEAKVVIKAAQDVLEANLDDEVYTPQETLQKLQQLSEYRKDIRDAETLIRLGKGAEAKTKADLVRTLASALRKELAERAKK